MAGARIDAKALTEHLITETPEVRRIVRALRRTVLRAAPGAHEAFKFHVLCYYRGDAWLKAIGGNICMIEIKDGRVLLSFIHGARIEDRDRAGLMFGKGKFKRFVRVPSVGAAQGKGIGRLVGAAAALRAWD